MNELLTIEPVLDEPSAIPAPFVLMISSVLGLRWKKHKVGNSIVKRVAVDVMNYLSPFQLSAKVLFHFQSMFKNIFAVDCQPSVAPGDTSRTLDSALKLLWMSIFHQPLVMTMTTAARVMFFSAILNITTSHIR